MVATAPEQPATPSPTGKWGFRWAVAVCAVAIVAAIGGPLLGKGTFLSVNQIGLREPWSASTPSDAFYQLPYSTDVIDSGTPSRYGIREALVDDGRIPLWNPYPNGGTPLGSTPSSGIFNPIVWPELLLGIEVGAAWAGLLRIALAAVGAFLLLRWFGVGRFAATCGGLVYCTSGFVVGWTNWPQADIAALIPFLFLTADRLRKRRRALDLVAFALVVAAMLLSGYPPLVFIILMALAAFLVVRWWEESRGTDPEAPSLWDRLRSAFRPVAWIVGGLALAGALVAFQLLPFLNFVNTYDLSYRERNVTRLTPPASLLTSIFPWALGSPQEGQSFSFFWSQEAGRTDFVEQFVFLGAAAVVCALLAVLWGRPRAVSRGIFWYCTAGVGLLVLMLFTTRIGPIPAGSALRRLLFLIPGTEQVPIPRFVSILLFLASLLAAFGIERIVDRAAVTFDRAFAWRAAGVGAFVAVIGFLAVRNWRNVTVEAVWTTGFAQRSWILEHSVVPVVLLVVTGLVVFAVRRARGALRTVAIAAIPVLLAAEGLMVTTDLWPRVPRSDFYPDTASLDYLSEHLGHERLAPAETEMLFATNPVYGLRSVGGHSFFAPTWADLVEATGTRYFQPTQLRLKAADIAVAGSPVLDRLGTRYWVASPGTNQIGIFPAPDTNPFGTIEEPPASTGEVTIGDGRVANATPTGGALRAVSVTLLGPIELRGNLVTLDVRIRNDAGRVLARGSRRIYDRPVGFDVSPTAGFRTGGPYWVAIPGEDLQPGEAATVEVSMRSDDPRDTLRLAATGDDDVALGYARPAPDGLELVYADAGATVYRRTRAMPRIRWAARSDVVGGRNQRVRRLADGTVPRDTVLLDRPGPAGSGQPATVDVREDSGDRIRAEVDAEGAGYLVVADALQDGWSARIDGRSVPLVDADHALVAIPVPEGDHTVELVADPRGWRTGIVISLLALALVVVLVIVSLVRRRRRAPVTGAADASATAIVAPERDGHGVDAPPVPTPTAGPGS